MTDQTIRNAVKAAYQELDNELTRIKEDGGIIIIGNKNGAICTDEETFRNAVEKTKTETDKSWIDAIADTVKDLYDNNKQKTLLEQLLYCPSKFHPNNINKNAENQ